MFVGGLSVAAAKKTCCASLGSSCHGEKIARRGIEGLTGVSSGEPFFVEQYSKLWPSNRQYIEAMRKIGV